MNTTNEIHLSRLPTFLLILQKSSDLHLRNYVFLFLSLTLNCVKALLLVIMLRFSEFLQNLQPLSFSYQIFFGFSAALLFSQNLQPLLISQHSPDLL